VAVTNPDLTASTLCGTDYSTHEVADRLGPDPATLRRYHTRVSVARHQQASDRIAGSVIPTVRTSERPNFRTRSSLAAPDVDHTGDDQQAE
jgi:hypothetical protein